MQAYTNFRVHRETYKELRKLRNKLKVESMDALINYLIIAYEVFKEES